MPKKEVGAANQLSNNERDRVSFKLRTYGLIRHLLVGFIIVSVASGAFSYIFYTPKAHSIEMQNSELLQRFDLLQDRIVAAELRLSAVSHRDNHMYRPLFGLDTIGSFIAADINTPRQNPLFDDGQSAKITQYESEINVLAHNLYHQSTSFDILQNLAKDKEKLANAIPAVWPIDRTRLTSGGRGYGMKFHPIYKRNMMHKGVDLPGTTGDPIYATADGVVRKSEQGYRTIGYGQMIKIHHDFGYQTLYGHLSKRYVFNGDSVKRGDIIGLMGSTGGSTGPHLHYEVIIGNQTVDPVNFFNRSMSKEEYQELQEQMAASGTIYEKYDF